MSWSTESNQISVGDTVYGNDGQKIGSVAEVQPGYIVVEKGFFFPTDLLHPNERRRQSQCGRSLLERG